MTQAFVLVHGDGEEKVAEAELVVGETGLLRAEEESDPAAGLREFGANARGSLVERDELVADLALADGGSADDEGAVGNGFGEGGVAGGGGEDGPSVNGGPRGLEGHGKLIHDAQRGEAEAGHGTRDRPDVRRVAGADEDNGDLCFFRGKP